MSVSKYAPPSKAEFRRTALEARMDCLRRNILKDEFPYKSEEWWKEYGRLHDEINRSYKK